MTETRVLPYNNRFQNAITFEMSMNLNEYTRTVYSIMDFMSELGGLFSAITLIFGTIIGVLQYRGMYMIVTSLMLKSRERFNQSNKDDKFYTASNPKLKRKYRID